MDLTISLDASRVFRTTNIGHRSKYDIYVLGNDYIISQVGDNAQELAEIGAAKFATVCISDLPKVPAELPVHPRLIKFMVPLELTLPITLPIPTMMKRSPFEFGEVGRLYVRDGLVLLIQDGSVLREHSRKFEFMGTVVLNALPFDVMDLPTFTLEELD